MKGQPYDLKCRKCHRGMRGYEPAVKGVCKTPTPPKLFRWAKSVTCGTIYRDKCEVECLDCGHVFWTCHPSVIRSRVLTKREAGR